MTSEQRYGKLDGEHL